MGRCPKTIILIEDDRLVSLGIKSLLKGRGYDVIPFYNGEEALEYIKADKPANLVLMDIDLGPGMDGAEAAGKILKHRNLPIVFLTSRENPSRVHKIRDIVKYGFIIKGSGDFVLLSSLDTAFNLFESQEKLKANEKRLKMIIETLPSLVIFNGPESDLPFFVSPNSAELTGYAPEELMSGYKNFVHPEDYDRIQKIMTEAIEKHTDGTDLQFKAVKRDGTPWHASCSWRSLFDSSGEYLGRVFQMQDITEQKRILLEKELLLKEVHHRIKNNMSVIASLLSLQANTLEEESAREALMEARSRVMNMRILYDKLYMHGGFSTASAGQYLGDILNHLEEEYSGAVIKRKIDDYDLNAKFLFPLGIILNETVTNAYKYAFPNGEGIIQVLFRKTDSRSYSLVVKDNGIGLSQAGRASHRDGFGFTLIHAMTGQMGGNVRLIKRKGIKWEISFKTE